MKIRTRIHTARPPCYLGQRSKSTKQPPRSRSFSPPIVSSMTGLTMIVLSASAHAQNRAVISAGISAMITPTVSVYGFYDGQIGSSNYTSNQFSAGVRIDF